MPEMPATRTHAHGARIFIAVLAMVIFWALGGWALHAQQLGLVFVALIAFLAAWIFAGVTWLRWVNARKPTASAQPRG